MIQLFLDIETLPDGKYPSLDEVKVDSRLKDPDKIAMAQERGLEATYTKRALVPHKGKILCIGGILDRAGEVNAEFMAHGDSTKETLKNFFKELHDNLEKKEIHLLEWVGYNIMDFDLPFIFLGTNKYFPQYRGYIPQRGHNIVDLMRVFNYGKYKDFISFKAACDFFGVPVKEDGIDGSMVYELYQDGDLKRILEYCRDDVRATRELYYKLF